MKKYCRIFFNADKQQAWFNKMSDSGFELVAKKGPCYQFKPCEKGEFVYKLEFLPRFLTAEMLETFGAEAVFSDMRRVCLKKRAKDGGFDPFSDSAERFRNFRLKFGIFSFLFAAALLLGTIYFGVSICYFQYYDTLLYMVCGAVALVLSVFLLIGLLRVNGAARKYRQNYNNRS
ncbi:MAG TPA: DUF2812 domain-containing protein [Candidatus Wallbacteria bacterium]|nr:DUF2812 domain-containing protein [Candidatus Wallbacteria bacterium]